MKLFLDTANIDLIKQWMPTGVIDGVTTNPSLIAQEKNGNIKAALLDICNMVNGDVSIEVVEKTPEKVYAQAKEISNLAKNVVVKIPFAQEYLPVISKLTKENIKINVTLIFSLTQALLVSKLNVKYISPFIGRWDDIDIDGMELIKDLVTMKKNYNFKTEILAASIRNVIHLQKSILYGADVATIPPLLLDKVFKHPLTIQGIEKFDNDWKKLNKTNMFNEK
ncbi:MAG: putative transaldolase [candidate division TM6 bacterium GW2011_GWF2_28_16]|nr:MAG: putative transaldolase [candidate division TM6 bacterium GW2011_GWF2_28_16]